MKLVAVTACPTGIAHSAMAAEALEVAARAAGHDIEVEIQGAAGGPGLSPATIAAAAAVVAVVVLAAVVAAAALGVLSAHLAAMIVRRASTKLHLSNAGAQRNT